MNDTEREAEINEFIANLAVKQCFTPENVQEFIGLKDDLEMFLTIYKLSPKRYEWEIRVLKGLQEKLLGAVNDLLAEHYLSSQNAATRALRTAAIGSLFTFITNYFDSLTTKNHLAYAGNG